MKIKIAAIGMAALLAACLADNGTTNGTSTSNVIANMQWSLEAGVKIGYRCAKYGGTTNDVEFICKSIRENKHEAVADWFKARQ